MEPIISLIFFHCVFGKNFLVEVENDPIENDLSSDEKFETELNNSLEDASEKGDKAAFKEVLENFCEHAFSVCGNARRHCLKAMLADMPADTV